MRDDFEGEDIFLMKFMGNLNFKAGWLVMDKPKEGACHHQQVE